MPIPTRPGPVFENLLPILKDLRTDRVVFTPKKPLSLSFLDLSFQILEEAWEHSRAIRRRESHPEFSDFWEDTPSTKIIQQMYIETISNGQSVILLLNTCPIAQIDIKGEVGMAEMFDLPPMSEDDFILWELLGAGTIKFEIKKDPEGLILTQIKKEEGYMNALEMRRTINISTGETSMEVSCKKHILLADPTLANLFNWTEVRAGRIHEAILKYK